MGLNVDIQTPIVLVNTAEYIDGNRKTAFDKVVYEQPLLVLLSFEDNSEFIRYTITMRTPGNDEELIIGLLIAEGIIKQQKDVLAIGVNQDDEHGHGNTWLVELKQYCRTNVENTLAYLQTYSSCGLCGNTSIHAIEKKQPPEISTKKAWLRASSIALMINQLPDQQVVFETTGGVHGAALFDKDGRCYLTREDIGRHNAMDKLIGAAFDAEYIEPAAEHVVVLTSRVSYEMVQKAVMAGIPVIVALGAVSSLAIQAATKFNITVIGFSKANRFVVYHGDWRIDK